MSRESSGERLFLLYAFSCVEFRIQLGLIDTKGVERLRSLIEKIPEADLIGTHRFIASCFQSAVSGFGEFAEIDCLDGNLWPVDKVRAFWRRHVGETPVSSGTVESVNGQIVKVGDCFDRKTISNDHFLEIKPGDTVYFHNRIIAEVDSLSDDRAAS